MQRAYIYLIIVWTVVCVSGLGVFLFEQYGPGSEAGMTQTLDSPLVTAGFWLFVWSVPATVLLFIGRRGGGQD